MITIDDKLYVTKEMAFVMMEYTRKIVLKKLLNRLSFRSDGKKKKLNYLLQNLNYYNGDTPEGDDYFELHNLISKFINNTSETEQTALYFWTLNHNYMMYYDEKDTEIEEEDTFDQRFGRELALKMYEPKVSGLKSDLEDLLYKYLLVFSSEFDFSCIDKSTIRTVKRTIKEYGNRFDF